MAEIKRGKAEADGVADTKEGAHSPQDAAMRKLIEDSLRETAPVGREMTVSVNPQGTLRNIGRWMYDQHLHRQPTDLELKGFVDDAARRNRLVTKEQRDNLQPGQVLKVMVPGSEQGAKVAAKPEPQPESKPRAETKTALKPEPKQEPKQEAKQETRHPLMKGGDSCDGDWAKMVAKWVTQNEGSRDKHLAYNANDMGHGISVGLLQWNQEKGKLPDLLKDSWVRTADFNGNKTLYSGMRKALADSEFQGVQDQLRNQNMVRACHVATDHGFKSLRGRAVVSDLFNQLGEGGARSALRKVPDGKGESARIEDLKRITGTRINGKDRVNTLEDNVKEIWRQIGGQT